MKQKIEVDVTAAIDGQWPKVFADAHNAFAQDSNWVVVVVRNVPNMVLYDSLHDDGYASKPKPQFMNTQTLAIGFKDFDSMAAWWTNPQPVMQGPETVTFGSLGMGAIFIYESQLFIVSEPYANNQARGFGLAVCPEHGFATLFYPDTDVIPFYGTITINVGRDAE